MSQSVDVLDSLGSLLTYPENHATGNVERCLGALKASNSPALPQISQFGEFVNGISKEALQEQFTQTFDINPVAALEVGWHLFGERYERGTFIVKMRQTLKRLDIPESAELPDHLTHVLEALGRMEEPESDEFAYLFVVPALEKMLTAYKNKKTETPYKSVLEAIVCEIQNRYTEPVPGDSHD